jgi:hypothetical protein
MFSKLEEIQIPIAVAPHLQVEPQPHFPPQQEDIFFREIIEVWKRFSLGIEEKYISHRTIRVFFFFFLGTN